MRPDRRSQFRAGLEDLEARRFVGRDAELEAVDAACRAATGGVVFIHGGAGVGKSGLLRMALRRQENLGRAVLRLSGAVGKAGAELGAVEALPRPLVAIDDLKPTRAAQGWLRETLLPILPGGSVLLIASRREPPPAWLAGALGSAVRTIELKPLGEEEARALLVARSLSGAAVDGAISWAQGWPAALVLLAAAEGAPPHAGAVVARLAGSELDALTPEVLGLAALSRIVDGRSLEAVAGVGDPEPALCQLRRLSVVERRPAGLQLHPLLRRALQEEMRTGSPDRERELRRRIADHLHLRAKAGENWLVVDLAELIEDPAVRWGFGGGEDSGLRAGALKPEELSLIERAVVRRWDAAWWESTRRWLLEAPQTGVVVRDRQGALRGFCVATSLGSLPPWGRDDPVIGGWVAHAEAASPIGDAVLWRDVLSFGDDRGNRVRALLNAAATLRSGIANPRWFYGPVDPGHKRELALARAVGARHLPELDVSVNGRLVQCHLIDHGPGGIVGLARDLVYRELGMAPRRPPTETQVRSALRALRRPADMTGSPFTADGIEPTEQRREIRARLTAAADAAFGTGDEERLLRAVLDHAYLDDSAAPDPSALNVSRATYYRRLRIATERLVRSLSEGITT